MTLRGVHNDTNKGALDPAALHGGCPVVRVSCLISHKQCPSFRLYFALVASFSALCACLPVVVRCVPVESVPCWTSYVMPTGHQVGSEFVDLEWASIHYRRVCSVALALLGAHTWTHGHVPRQTHAHAHAHAHTSSCSRQG